MDKLILNVDKNTGRLYATWHCEVFGDSQPLDVTAECHEIVAKSLAIIGTYAVYVINGKVYKLKAEYVKEAESIEPSEKNGFTRLNIN